MPEKKAPPRWRLDAIALTIFAAGGLLAGAVGTYAPLSGGPNLLGALGDDLAELVVDPLGWAAGVFLAGWFVLAGLLVLTRNPVRLAVRFAGWVILVACAAVAADRLGPRLPAIAVAGRGGSVGAYVAFQLEEIANPAAEQVALIAAVLCGLLLAADRLVSGLLRLVWGLLRRVGQVAAWGNDKVAAG
ncbi:MAG TPA: DNA translocase FtsK 4TM domain-containing protein, partial [Gemmataceae bacterium]|nr:DNA translocase FtsK 4TM domain-containing protein [Gemmataceae bacterium]